MYVDFYTYFIIFTPAIRFFCVIIMIIITARRQKPENLTLMYHLQGLFPVRLSFSVFQ